MDRDEEIHRVVAVMGDDPLWRQPTRDSPPHVARHAIPAQAFDSISQRTPTQVAPLEGLVRHPRTERGQRRHQHINPLHLLEDAARDQSKAAIVGWDRTKTGIGRPERGQGELHSVRWVAVLEMPQTGL